MFHSLYSSSFLTALLFIPFLCFYHIYCSYYSYCCTVLAVPAPTVHPIVSLFLPFLLFHGSSSSSSIAPVLLLFSPFLPFLYSRVPTLPLLALFLCSCRSSVFYLFLLFHSSCCSISYRPFFYWSCVPTVTTVLIITIALLFLCSYYFLLFLGFYCSSVLNIPIVTNYHSYCSPVPLFLPFLLFLGF